MSFLVAIWWAIARRIRAEVALHAPVEPVGEGEARKLWEAHESLRRMARGPRAEA